MKKFKKFNLYKVITVIFVILQILQPVAQVTAETISTTTPSGLNIVNAKQISENTVEIGITLTNLSDSKKLDSISFSDDMIPEDINDVKILDSNNQSAIGSFSISDNKINIETNPGVGTEPATLNINFTKINKNAVNTLKYGSQVIKITPLIVPAQTSQEPQDSSKVPLASTKSSERKERISAPAAKAISKLDEVGTDLSKYLPGGTLITNAKATFTDSKGNAVDPDDVTKDTNINLAFDWALPNTLLNGYTVKAGDYFVFNLPSNITYKPGTGELQDTSGEVFANYSITSDGKVTFIFTNSVLNSDNVSGTFNYTSVIKQDSNSGQQTISIDTTTGPVEIPITVKPIGGNSISKTGNVVGQNSSGNNPTGITWDVTINTNGEVLNNAVVSDPMPTDTTGKVPTLVKTISIYPLTVDLLGNVVSQGPALTEGKDYIVDPVSNSITLAGDYAKTNQAFKIEYTSDIDSSKIPDEGGSLTFTNKATLTNGGNSYPADATVNAEYGKLLTKNYLGADSSGSQVLNWEIDYNYGEKSLPAGTKIVDTPSDGQIFYGTPVLKDESGNTIDASMYTIDTDNTTSPASMTITFPNGLKQGVKISYKTQVTGAIDSSINVENEAESDGQTVSAGNNSVASQGLTKTLGTVDYNKKTVGWNININKARQDMSNYQLDDEIPVGLTVDDSTFKLFDNDTKTELVRGTDYTITLTPTGFSLEFIGNLKSQAKDSYTLSYVTSFETLKLTGKTWTNNVTATWVDQKGKSHTNNGTANFTPKVEYVNDGSKSGSYNAVSKIITWTVVTNYNQRVLNNASITDKIVGDQDYVPDSVKLYEATINSDGSYTLVKPEISNNATYDAENNLLTVPLPNGSSKAYVLTYQTSLVGKIINQKTYDNTAQYVNDNISSNLVASVSVPNSGSVIEKSGSQDPSNSSYALWNIWVNKSQSTISNATVTDVPSDNQIIDESSITIYPTKVSSDGSYVENTTAPLQLGTDYTVNLVTDNTSGQQTLTIVFKNTINTAYSIHYRSLINSSLINDTLTNDASIKGTGEKPVSDDIISSTQVVNNGGSASGKNMGLVITKTDGNTGKALVGATFEIWSDVSGNKGQLLRSGTTDSSGKINWKNLKSGKYILVESSAPDGYVISTMLKNGQEISLQYNEVDENQNKNLSLVNFKGQITIHKTDRDTGKDLAGATFDLYQKLQSGDIKIASELVTDANGNITYAGLDAGNYYIIETSAPAGYELDSAPQDVTVNGDNIQPTINISNSETTGEVLLTKIDSDTGATLQGAVFTLYDSKGTLIKSGLVTDASGKIMYDGLKPGNYYFKETQAPTGYLLNSNKIGFTIVLQVVPQVAQVSVENSAITGAVVLTKTDSDTGKILAGAIFSLFKKDGDLIKSGLTTDSNGEINVSNLTPGDYYFIETEAPAGYELNSSKLPFTVELQSTPKVAQVVAENSETTGSVILNKIDSDTGKKLSGAVFSLFDNSGKEIKSGLVSDINGQITVAGLKPGNYYFVETKAPAGFNFEEAAQYHFTIELQTTSKLATINVENSEATGSVLLTKIDSDTKKVLSGATFSLFNSEGSEIKSSLISDSKGQISVDGLKPGKYYFKETSAPAGYILNNSKLNFEVELQTEHKVAQVLAENAEKTGSVILTKTDKTTGKTLSGAKFNLYNSLGKLVKGNLITNSNGCIEVENLKPGNYYFVEILAPNGYELVKGNKTLFSIEFQKTAKITRVVVENTKEMLPKKVKDNSTNLPKTGDNSNVLYTTLGVLAILFSTLLLLKKKKF